MIKKKNINHNLGFVIIETDLGKDLPERKLLTEKELNNRFNNLPPFAFKKDRAVAEVTLQEVEEKNRNGRWYSKKELFPELTSPRTVELLETGNLRSESGHPLSKELARQQTIVKSNCSCIILKLWTEGNFIKALVRGTNNKLGEEFNEDILDGISPAYSLRALGGITNTSKGAEVRNIKVITWDEVIFPSHKRAYTNKVLSIGESAITHIEDDHGMLIPLMTKDVVECIKQESYNFKQITESFNSLFSDISLLDNGRNIQLIDTVGNVVIMPTENYIRDEIINYCSAK